MEQQEAVKDILSWQRTVKASETAPAGRASGASAAAGSSKSAAAHTYDKGYKKWEEFDAVRTPRRFVTPDILSLACASRARDDRPRLH